MATKKNDYSSIIDAINKTNNSSFVDIYVPSIDKNVKFKPLTVQHQKKIITAALEATAVNATHYAILTSNLIKESCVEPDITFSSIDRLPVLVGLRVNTLGYDVPTLNSSGDKVFHNIKSLYNNFQSFKITKSMLEPKTIKANNITVTIQSPTLDVDIEVNNKALPVVSKHAKDSDTFKNIVGEAVVYEYVKYIKSLKIENQHVEFNHKHATKLTHIVEALPMAVVSDIVQEINKIKDYTDRFTTLKHGDNVFNIITDARFFSSD